MSFKQVEIKDKPESMKGWDIFCFDCKKKVTKDSLRARHRGHDVDWVRGTERHG